MGDGDLRRQINLYDSSHTLVTITYETLVLVPQNDLTINRTAFKFRFQPREGLCGIGLCRSTEVCGLWGVHTSHPYMDRLVNEIYRVRYTQVLVSLVYLYKRTFRLGRHPPKLERPSPTYTRRMVQPEIVSVAYTCFQMAKQRNPHSKNPGFYTHLVT